MAKKKNLILSEATTRRFMTLAGVPSLSRSFLKEQYGKEEEMDEARTVHDDSIGPEGVWDDDEDSYDEEEFGMHDVPDEECPECGAELNDGMCEECGHQSEHVGFEDEEEFDDEEEEGLFEGEEEDEEEELQEGEEEDEEEDEEEELQENIRKSMKRLKKLLEQADAPMPPAPEDEAPEAAEPPPALEGADETESKIKDFVKKLGELVQETLGVEVTVEEGEPEGEEGAPEPEEEAPAPEPMAEAINRLVSRVANRVKARLEESKKGAADKKISMKRDAARKEKEAKKQKALKEKQVASKKKEMEAKKAKALKEKEAAAKKKKVAAKKK